MPASARSAFHSSQSSWGQSALQPGFLGEVIEGEPLPAHVAGIVQLLVGRDDSLGGEHHPAPDMRRELTSSDAAGADP
jgi:hypothetical protein